MAEIIPSKPGNSKRCTFQIGDRIVLGVLPSDNSPACTQSSLKSMALMTEHWVSHQLSEEVTYVPARRYILDPFAIPAIRGSVRALK